MAAQEPVSPDVFQGSDKVEILGRLPSLLWSYVNTTRWFLENLEQSPEDRSDSVKKMEKILYVLISAASHLGNEDLKVRLNVHSEKLTAWSQGKLSNAELTEPLQNDLETIEKLAGPRPESVEDGLYDEAILEREVERLENIKTGRSADILVSNELLTEIRTYLTGEVMTEGMSSMLVIDNAGTLIVNVGNKIDVDAISLAAVAAANFAATEKIAHLIGERDFVLLFYKGHNESFHFRRVGQEYIIVTIFNNSLSLGLLRLKLSEVAQELEKKLPKREG